MFVWNLRGKGGILVDFFVHFAFLYMSEEPATEPTESTYAQSAINDRDPVVASSHLVSNRVSRMTAYMLNEFAASS